MSTTAEKISTATCIEELPPLWGEVASLAGTVPLVDVPTLAGHFKKPKREIESILAHPIVAEHVEFLKAQITLKVGSEAGTLTAARSTVIQQIKDHLDEHGSEMKLDDLLKAAKFLCDYNPDRKFVKVEQREERRVVEHTIREHALNDLKEIAFSNFSRKAITAEVSPVVSASYAEVISPLPVDEFEPEGMDDARFSEEGMNAIERELAKEGTLF